MHHKFLNEYRLTLRGNEAIVLLTASNYSEEKCKGCAPILSAFKGSAQESVREAVFAGFG
jgi:hypothetical protein